MEKTTNSGERLLPGGIGSEYEFLMYLRHLFAYKFAAGLLAKKDCVLEIGCGEGYGARVLSGAAGRVTAIDTSAGAIEAAAKKYAAENLFFSRQTGARLAFPDGTFDAVVGFQVIEHVHDEALFLAEAARVLKEGGLCLFTTPNRVYRLKPGQKPWFKHHVREYERSGLESLLAGRFQEVEVKFVNSPETLCRMERRVAKMAALAQKLDPLRLRELFPYSLKKAVFSLLGQKAAAGAGAWNWSTGDFSASAAPERGLDLLALCRK